MGSYPVKFDFVLGRSPQQDTFQTVEASLVRVCEAISPRYRIQQQNSALLLAQPAKTSKKFIERYKKANTVVFVIVIDLPAIAVDDAVLLL